jgi:hypothetical protein
MSEGSLTEALTAIQFYRRGAGRPCKSPETLMHDRRPARSTKPLAWEGEDYQTVSPLKVRTGKTTGRQWTAADWARQAPYLILMPCSAS